MSGAAGREEGVVRLLGGGLMLASVRSLKNLPFDFQGPQAGSEEESEEESEGWESEGESEAWESEESSIEEESEEEIEGWGREDENESSGEQEGE